MDKHRVSAPLAGEEDILSINSNDEGPTESAFLLPPDTAKTFETPKTRFEEAVLHPLEDSGTAKTSPPDKYSKDVDPIVKVKPKHVSFIHNTEPTDTSKKGDQMHPPDVVKRNYETSDNFAKGNCGKSSKTDDPSVLFKHLSVVQDPESWLPSYADVQHSVPLEARGAGPELSSAIEPADDSCHDDRSPLNVTGSDDEINSKTDLFAQEQLFTPGKGRKEYMCGMFLKYSIFIFNFLFWVASVCGFGFGYWILTSKGQIFTTGAYLFLDPAVMLCMVSCTIFLVAFFGFLGALRENIRLLKIFRVCLVFVLLIQIALGILVFVFYTMPEARDSLLSGPEAVLKDAIKSYHDDTNRRKWIDIIQKEFQCCGISHSKEGYRDWQVNMYFNCTSINPSIHRCAVPVSCCIFEPGDYINVMCGFHTTDQPREKVFNRIYTKGCLRGVTDWMRVHESFIGGFLLGFVTPQVLGLIFSTMYMRHIKRSRTRWRLLKRTT